MHTIFAIDLYGWNYLDCIQYLLSTYMDGIIWTFMACHSQRLVIVDA